MKILVVGCGNAFSNRSFNQSFLLEETDIDGLEKNLLIDCGYQVPNALIHANIPSKSVQAIYISHLHADHVGGLEYFAFTRYDWKNKPRSFDEAPAKYAPMVIVNTQLMKDLWNKSIRGGLESMEGFVATLKTYFEPKSIEPNCAFNWCGWKVELIQQIHIMSGSVIMPSFGLIFSKTGHKTVYFTTDSQHCSPRQIEDFYKKADIIFQDCECVGVNMKDHKFLFGSGVHANYAQLAGWEDANSIKLPTNIKNKMFLSHYQDFVLDDKDFMGNHCVWQEESLGEGFAGFVSVGNRFEI